ncbi:hypothetical protein DXG03_006440 [Asterophora parasitica]|uniref:Uncharacterized protein n=1 Tax=Asterophora parasitica TaxID=117018 RepID=A0A9P7G2P6_9AGAR|nr:hypothetical protein DXG03_006440 [Asterophora parasitica]
MPLRNRTSQPLPTPIVIVVHVEVETHVGEAAESGRENQDSHAQDRTSTSKRSRSTYRDLFTMSLPRSNYDPRRVLINPFPDISLGKHRRTIGVYLAGALFALANWTFLDAAILSAHAHSPWGQPDTPPPVHVTFVDWIPGICSLLGYLVINLIDKDRVRGEEGFGDSRAVWRARLVLFIGFALMAGGLAGSVTVLILKYVLNGYPDQFTYYGYANVSQSVALMLSAIVLWIAQSGTNEYEYNLTL